MHKNTFTSLLLAVFFIVVVSCEMASAKLKAYTYTGTVNGISVSDSIVWQATTGGLVRFNHLTGARRVFTTVDGLPSNTVYAVEVDATDTVWIGTDSGLSMFDGVKFKSYPLLPVRTIKIVGTNIWMGTWGSYLVRYDGVSFTTFSSGANSGHINDLFVDGANLWIASYYGRPQRFNTTTQTYDYSLPLGARPYYSIAVDSLGNVWLGWSDALSKFDGVVESVFYSSGVIYGSTFDIAVTSGNVIYATTTKQGLLRIQDGIITDQFVDTNGVSSNVVVSLAQDGDTLWIGTGNYLTKYDGGGFQKFIPNELYSNTIKGVVVDSNGDRWIARGNVSEVNIQVTRPGGVTKFDGRNFINYDTGLGGGIDVTSISIDKADSLYIGTSRGVYRLDGDLWTDLNIPSHDWVRGLDVDKNKNVWVACLQGMWKYNGVTWTQISPGQSEGVAVDRTDTVWFARGGLIRYDGLATRQYTTADGLPSNAVLAVTVDSSGLIWAGTNQGLCKFDGTTFTTYTTADGLPGNVITSLAADDTAIIIGLGYRYYLPDSGRGASILDINSGVFRNYSTDSGLPTNDIQVVSKDRVGGPWFCSANSGAVQLETPNTTVGANVTVNFPSQNLSITFGNVSVPGVTIVTRHEAGPEIPGFEVADKSTQPYYTISTTATFTGAVVTITYDSSLTPQEENALRLLHYDGVLPDPDDVTDKVNKAQNTITSLPLNSFSDLVVAIPVLKATVRVEPSVIQQKSVINGNGVITVFIEAVEGGRVLDVIPDSVRILNAPPVRSELAGRDPSTRLISHMKRSDLDLSTIRFNTLETVHVTGKMQDGRRIRGSTLVLFSAP